MAGVPEHHHHRRIDDIAYSEDLDETRLSDSEKLQFMWRALFGFWDFKEGQRQNGVIVELQTLSAQFSKLLAAATPAINAFTIAVKYWKWFGLALLVVLGIPAVHALGVPTEAFGKLLWDFFSRV